jgi:tellurite resistance protein
VNSAAGAAERPPAQRVPLTTLAIPLGLAGLAQVWTLATVGLGTPFVYGGILWSLAAVAGLVAVAEHLRRGWNAEQTLTQQLAHHTQGPLAGLLPISVMLLGTGLHRTSPRAGTAVTLGALALATCFALWILVYWARGNVALGAVHGGYYVPVSAAALVGALASGLVGVRWLAQGSLAVGVTAWVVTTAVVVLRLARRPSLSKPLVPTLAILASPPAIGSLAWLAISGGEVDGVFIVMSLVAALMVLVQLWLLPRYLSLPFTVGHWAFTFPAASVASLAMTWVRLEQPPGWRVGEMGLVLVATALIGLIAVKSIVIARRRCGI